VFGDLATARRQWHRTAIGALALVGLEGLGLVRLATQSRVEPYVVEVDRFGAVRAAAPAAPLTPSAEERVLKAMLATFIHDVRSISGDPTTLRDQVQRAYAVVGPEAGAYLDAYFASPAHDPRLLRRDGSRLIEVASVLRRPGSSTWTVRWTETTVPRVGGGVPTMTAWEGNLTTRLVPPTTTDRLLLNPLGLYITQLDWTQVGERVLADSVAATLPFSGPPTPAPVPSSVGVTP
jgi:type IV secretion system protein VirB5